MKKTIIILTLLVLTTLSIGFFLNESTKPEELIGGQKDKHGCLGPAGYLWCESKQKCLRAWEEYCQEYPDQFTEEKIRTQKYIEKNIKELSPIKPVLGGSWYTTSIKFIDTDKVQITYEDGHVEKQFTADYKIKNEQIIIENIVNKSI